MRIVGEWLLCDDGVTRPAVDVSVQGVAGHVYSARFLIH